MSNKLVAYFSASGVTAKVAETLDWNEGREQIGNVGNDAVLAFVRAAEQRRLLFLFNFTESPQYCALTSLFNKEEQARELLTGRRIRGSQESLDLKAYEFLWLIVEA